MEKRFVRCCFFRTWRMASRYRRCGSVGGGGAVDDVCHTKVQAKGALMIRKDDRWNKGEGRWIVCKRDASRWWRTRRLRAWLLIFSFAHDYCFLWTYHRRKVKAMLDNSTFMGIILKPLRLQKVFLKTNYAASLSRSPFIPQHCVKSLSSLLSRTQEDVQNAMVRSHVDLHVVQRLVYKRRNNNCIGFALSGNRR